MTLLRAASARAPPSAAVRKMRSPATTGEEWPGGRLVFHTYPWCGLKVIGSLDAAGATPDPFGPRNCIHCAVALLAKKSVIPIHRIFAPYLFASSWSSCTWIVLHSIGRTAARNADNSLTDSNIFVTIN